MVKKKPLVDIIICQKNNKAIISACLDSVKNQTYKRWKCIVVDDHSTDGGCEFIEKKYPFVKIFRLKGKGPSYNRNIGIKSTFGKYIVTMDSDAVLARNWLSEMIKFMEKNPKIGVCSGKILDQNNPDVISIAGGGLSKSGIVYHRGTGQNTNTSKYNQIKKTIYLCSASMITRRKVFDKIGYFDPDYIYSHEDLDICWRTNMAGFDVVYYPKAESYHQMGCTVAKFPSAKLRYLGCRNRILTLLKNYQIINLLKYSPLFIIHFFYLLIFKNHKSAIINAYLWNVKNIKSTINKRNKIQHTRVKSDQELFKLF